MIQQFEPLVSFFFFFAVELYSKEFIRLWWLLMAQINYVFICVYVYISLLTAYTFRTLFINLSYTGVFGYSLLSLFFS